MAARIELRDAAEKIPGERGAWMRLRFAGGIRCRRARRSNRSQRPKRRSSRVERLKWRPISSSSTTKPTSASWSRASCRTKATAPAPRATATTRWRRSRRAGRTWSSSTSGCRAAGSTACSCSTRVKEEHPELPVVMISGHGNIETAVAAIKRGAYDFIEKPFKADRLVLVADRALETSRLKREVQGAQAARAGADRPGRPLAGDQPAAPDRSRRSRRPTAAS